MHTHAHLPNSCLPNSVWSYQTDQYNGYQTEQVTYSNR
jgi:hypothetical protein